MVSSRHDYPIRPNFAGYQRFLDNLNKAGATFTTPATLRAIAAAECLARMALQFAAREICNRTLLYFDYQPCNRPCVVNGSDTGAVYCTDVCAVQCILA